MTTECRGRVTGLFTAPSQSDAMVSHDTVTVEPGGVDGDRYRRGTGYYSAVDGCPVTLVDAAVLDEARRVFGLDLSDGRHRRNVVVRGLDLSSLLDGTFTLGEATLRGTRLRPPCDYLAELVDDEAVLDALRERNGGICADVVEPGTVSVGDELRVTEVDPRTAGREIATRLGADGATTDETDADEATTDETAGGSR